MKSVTVRRAWSGYCRGYNNVEIQVPEGTTDEEAIEIAKDAYDIDVNINIVRNDTETDSWEVCD